MPLDPAGESEPGIAPLTGSGGEGSRLTPRPMPGPKRTPRPHRSPLDDRSATSPAPAPAFVAPAPSVADPVVADPTVADPVVADPTVFVTPAAAGPVIDRQAPPTEPVAVPQGFVPAVVAAHVTSVPVTSVPATSGTATPASVAPVVPKVAPARSGVVRRGRRVRRVVRRIELWSVLKLSLVLYTCLYVTVLGALALVWSLAYSSRRRCSENIVCITDSCNAGIIIW